VAAPCCGRASPAGRATWVRDGLAVNRQDRKRRAPATAVFPAGLGARRKAPITRCRGSGGVDSDGRSGGQADLGFAHRPRHGIEVAGTVRSHVGAAVAAAARDCKARFLDHPMQGPPAGGAQ